MTAADSSTQDRDDGDGEGAGALSPLSALVIALSLAVVGVGIWAASRRDEVAVWQLTADLPANHVLTDRDLKLDVRRSDAGFVDHAIGRMTIRPLSQGAPIRQADLGPDVTGRLGRDSVVVGIRATRDNAVAGSLRAGDRVELIVDETGRMGPVEGIVMGMSGGGQATPQRYDVAVAVRRADARRHRWLRTTSDIRIVRELTPAP